MHFVALLCLFLSCCIIMGSSDESCYPVQQCSITPSLDKYSYRISTSNWGSSSNMVCPRSDSSVSFWVFEFNDPNTQQLVSGNYCSVGAALAVESVCNNNGNSLVFRNLGDTVYNKTGLYAMKFSSVESDFTADIPFYFAPTGIYSTNDTIYYSLEQNRVPSWHIFHKKISPEIRLYFQGSLIANQSVSMDPNTYAFFPETTICLPTATGEITSVYTLQLLAPINHLLAGVYTVIVIQDGITYSSDVTIDFPSHYSRIMEPTSIMLTSTMPENTPSISFSPTITSSPSNESIDPLYIVFIALALAILIIIIVVITAALCIAYRKKWKCCNNPLKTESTIPLHDVIDGRTPDNSPDSQRFDGDPVSPNSIVATPSTNNTPTNTPINTGHIITRTPPTFSPPITELPISTPVIVRDVHHDGTTNPTPPTDDVIIPTTGDDTPVTPPNVATPTMTTPTIPPTHITVGGDVTDGSSVTIINNYYYPKPPISDDTSDAIKEIVEGQREQIEIGRETNEILTAGLIDVRESKVETPDHDNGDITIDATSNPSIGYHTSDSPNASTAAPSRTVGLISSDPPSQSDTVDENDGLVERGPIIAEPPASASNDLKGLLFDLEVEFRDFNNFVGKHISAKWKTFGEIIGLTHNDLRVIAEENPTINNRLSPILDAWKKTHFKTTPFNWRHVILILREMGEHSVADRAIEELMKGSGAQ